MSTLVGAGTLTLLCTPPLLPAATVKVMYIAAVERAPAASSGGTKTKTSPTLMQGTHGGARGGDDGDDDDGGDNGECAAADDDVVALPFRPAETPGSSYFVSDANGGPTPGSAASSASTVDSGRAGPGRKEEVCCRCRRHRRRGNGNGNGNELAITALRLS